MQTEGQLAIVLSTDVEQIIQRHSYVMGLPEREITSSKLYKKLMLYFDTIMVAFNEKAGRKLIITSELLTLVLWHEKSIHYRLATDDSHSQFL